MSDPCLERQMSGNVPVAGSGGGMGNVPDRDAYVGRCSAVR
jgi:hypothetical protein